MPSRPFSANTTFMPRCSSVEVSANTLRMSSSITSTLRPCSGASPVRRWPSSSRVCDRQRRLRAVQEQRRAVDQPLGRVGDRDHRRLRDARRAGPGRPWSDPRWRRTRSAGARAGISSVAASRISATRPTEAGRRRPRRDRTVAARSASSASAGSICSSSMFSSPRQQRADLLVQLGARRRSARSGASGPRRSARACRARPRGRPRRPDRR